MASYDEDEDLPEFAVPSGKRKMLQPEDPDVIPANEPDGLGERRMLRDKMGRFRTESLFCETIDKDQIEKAGLEPVFSLKATDHEWRGKPMPSMKALYMQYRDPTEYVFALAVLGSWKHWEKLCKARWFQPFLNEWRTELEMKVRAEAVAKMIEQAKNGDRKAMEWVASGGWRTRQGAGRPSKAEKDAAIRAEAGLDAGIRADAERLGLRLVKG